MPLEELFEGSLSLASTEHTLRQIPQSRGVLLFADKDRQPIQILLASSLRRTALAKLSESKPEPPARKADLRPIARFLYYTPIHGELHSAWFYNRLVHLLFEDQANDLICLPPPHCVRIDPDEAWASFGPSLRPFGDPSAVYFGPFPTRKSAEFFARTYNDVFTLCRNRRGCEQGQNCTYFQMGLCPAPCLQKGRESQYRLTVLQAIQAASGPVDTLQEKLAVEMKAWAGKMQFEKAQTIKEQIERLGKLKSSACRWTRRMDTLKILHIAQGPRVSSYDNLRQKNPVYSGYLITSARIEKVPNFTPAAIPRLLDSLHRPPGACCLASKSPAEHIALLSLFLFKSRPPGLWLDLCENPDLDEKTLHEAMTECFRKAAREETQ